MYARNSEEEYHNGEDSDGGTEDSTNSDRIFSVESHDATGKQSDAAKVADIKRKLKKNSCCINQVMIRAWS